jgi:signal transduction histidine kinase
MIMEGPSSPKDRAMSAPTSPNESPGSSRKGGWWGIALIVVLALAQLAFLLHGLINNVGIPSPPLYGVISFIVVPTILVLTDRLLRARPFQTRLLAGGGVAIVVNVLACLAIRLWLLPDFKFDVHPRPRMPGPHWGEPLGLGFIWSFLVVGIWSFVVAVPRLAQQESQRAWQVQRLELEAARLRSEAELRLLRSQLEPHFLLNTLNLISGLIGMDVDKAQRILANLGDLLRDSTSQQEPFQTVEEQIAWLERYCEILETRHRPRISFRWNIDRQALGVRIPRLILQPLVENAIVHGALLAQDRGVVSLRIALPTPEQLECAVEDNGPNLSRTERPGSIGLRSVERRLDYHCPGSSLALTRAGLGTQAHLIIKLPADSGTHA